MTVDAKRELQRLMKRHRIFLKSSLDAARPPTSHKEIFEDIQTLGDYKFGTYCVNVDIRLKDEPWRKHTKARVEWLSKRAAELVEQHRNEAGWRLSLENHVLLRFGIEVACSTCRARIWRSEIESSMNDNDDFEANLTRRRRNRRTCSCSPDNRLWDVYDIGINAIFDDRAEEVMCANLPVDLNLAVNGRDRPRRPDRVFGLRETKNFEALLDQTPSYSPRGETAIRESIRITPFRDTAQPLLFPFLILESKSEDSSDGFGQIQCQTAFPIKALLELQYELQGKVINATCPGPLLWFLGHRGDSWRVYGCYVTNGEPKSFEIVLLWNGSLLSRDDSLQLVLILDYIFDWARDVYRPSILLQLKSIASGKAYDEVSFFEDSDVQSLRKYISNWMPAAQSVAARLGPRFEHGVPIDLSPGDNRSLPFPVPKTEHGTVCSANVVTKRLAGLCLWEANFMEFFEMVTTRKSSEKDKTQSVAREIIGCFSAESRQKYVKFRKTRHRPSHPCVRSESSLKEGSPKKGGLERCTLCLTGSQLQALEESWIGGVEPTSDVPALPPDERFYCLISFECFLTTSWEVVEQITYLAITRPVADLLTRYASYKRGASIPFFPDSWWIACADTALQECINCLSSASSSQLLLAAISAKSVTIRAQQETLCRDDTTVELLDFDCNYGWGQGVVVEKHIKATQRTKVDVQRVQNLSRGFRTLREDHLQRSLQTNFSFCRNFERATPILDSKRHDVAACSRCSQTLHGNAAGRRELWTTAAIQSTNGMVLVEASETSGILYTPDDLCLFVLHPPDHLNAASTIPRTLNQILEAGKMYHSIRNPKRGWLNHFQESHYPNIMWNLPLIYWAVTPKAKNDMKNWLGELGGAA
ncbi:hypothetical protein K469DRAFT_809553 [Zopfia rhizophila CBS 207.26]|uniref:Uncharacterized protein n=1 Tax=Zopfia rhizophila CBS 207.26 TaxID=1314779 RepID=A0A6A6DCT7_9PEZI|nr:hypothetical protein K469DRAFT_809553 [Zopfia rhizophila CBS 207.26]